MNNFFMIATILGLVLFSLNAMAWILSGFDNKYSGMTVLVISIFLFITFVGSHLFGEVR